MKNFIFSLLILATFALSGCAGQGGETEVPITVIVSDDGGGYPANSDCMPDGYPSPSDQVGYPYPVEDESTVESSQSELPECEPTRVPLPPISLTVTPGTGSVIGKLLVDGEPVSAAILYASAVLEGGGGNQAVRFNRGDQNRGFSQQDGSFKIINLGPGIYGLVLDTIQQAYLLDYPDGEPALFEILGDGQVDLGMLDYEQLPFLP